MTKDEIDQLCKNFAPVIKQFFAEKVGPLEARIAALEALKVRVMTATKHDKEGRIVEMVQRDALDMTEKDDG